ncbi:polyprenyl synthetase family protein [Halothermothrix orenii]|uniref:Heptaprenyl diphosphate synthase component II n=1 Tax=Halothermothrix orenii (strain H 168 / OCM 544 / DSM 9562) TaxID=373903 RepID=B8CY63_HALOH|nr:polyprenyl synthetase family protein [Halothermothrix orenii]ACL70232.1 heptaprenyl diphosphate synthase component II [Halothermothrix orenii H 168]
MMSKYSIAEYRQRFAPVIEKIDEIIWEITKTRVGLINIATRDLVESGGKRLRPLLVVLSARLGDFDKEKIYHIASAIELLHMATLVHDDIIDEARIRRGEISAQSKFGKDVAVFLGDFMLSRAFDIFTLYLSRHSLRKLNKVVGLICEGEIDQYEDKFEYKVSIREYLRRIRRKTALLFGLSTYIGAYESGVRGRNLSNIYRFGLRLGTAFQIQDDILDFVADPEESGKAIGQDLINGIYNLPVIYLVQDEIFRDRAREILGKDRLSVSDVVDIINMVNNSKAINQSRELGKRYIEKSQKYVEHLPDERVKEELNFILSLQLNRQQ